jgi:hypothetical protein
MAIEEAERIPRRADEEHIGETDEKPGTAIESRIG